MRRCVIVGGAEINNYEAIRADLRDDDYFVYCDCGLNHAGLFDTDNKLNRKPDLIVADFDSYDGPEFTGVETIVLPQAKDDTDTVFAAKEALARGFSDFLFIGAVGGRFDHSFGNAALLLLLHEAGAKALLIDDYSEMEVIASPNRKTALISDECSYFSLLCAFGPVDGVTITGAKFPLDNASFKPDYQYGISNEVLPGETACVTVESGAMLLVKIFRE